MFRTVKYFIGTTSQPGGTVDDTTLVVLPADSRSHCVEGLTMQHNTTYYVMIVAVNDGHAGANVTQYSNGGMCRRECHREVIDELCVT